MYKYYIIYEFIFLEIYVNFQGNVGRQVYLVLLFLFFMVRLANLVLDGF